MKTLLNEWIEDIFRSNRPIEAMQGQDASIYKRGPIEDYLAQMRNDMVESVKDNFDYYEYH